MCGITSPTHQVVSVLVFEAIKVGGGRWSWLCMCGLRSLGAAEAAPASSCDARAAGSATGTPLCSDLRLDSLRNRNIAVVVTDRECVGGLSHVSLCGNADVARRRAMFVVPGCDKTSWILLVGRRRQLGAHRVHMHGQHSHACCKSAAAGCMPRVGVCGGGVVDPHSSCADTLVQPFTQELVIISTPLQPYAIMTQCLL